jgi:hypothetical protein
LRSRHSSRATRGNSRTGMQPCRVEWHMSKENTEGRIQETGEYTFASIADLSLRSRWQARAKRVLWSGSLSVAVCCGEARLCRRRLRQGLVWQQLSTGRLPDQRTVWSGCPRCNLSTSIVALGRRRQHPFHFVQKWAVFVFHAFSILYLYWRYTEAILKGYWRGASFSVFGDPFFSFSNTAGQTYDAGQAISKCAMADSVILCRNAERTSIKTTFFLRFDANRPGGIGNGYPGVVCLWSRIIGLCGFRGNWIMWILNFCFAELLWEGFGGGIIKMLIDCVDGAPKHGWWMVVLCNTNWGVWNSC